MKKKLVKILTIIVLFVILFVGFKSFAANDSDETVTVKFKLNGGSLGTLCKRATNLHTEECSQTDSSSYCSGSGLTTGSIITYGNINESPTLTSGDAFDCDVNGDGTYDAETERFYYVTDMDNDTAVLIYSNNVSNGEIDNVSSHVYNSYNSQTDNGPVVAVKHLPTTLQWSNTSLKSTIREIKDETDTTKLQFDYSGFSARLLTYQELYNGCYDGMINLSERGAIESKCSYMLENTVYSNDDLAPGFWLENAVSSASDSGARAWSIGARYKDLEYAITFHDNYGVRPVIEVPKINISLSNDELYDNIITVKKSNTINLNDYNITWNNKKNNSYADLSWTCINQTNNSSISITSSDFSASNYEECMDSNGNIEITANWDEYHIVTLNGTGGNFDGETYYIFNSYPESTYDLTTYKPKREGYKLLGYGFNSEGVYSTLSVNGSEYKAFSTGHTDIKNYTLNGHVDLYAIWDKEYTISYNGMGGNNGPNEEKYGESEEITIPNIIPVKDGYKFEGWSLSPSGTSAIYNSGDKISMSSLISQNSSSTSEIYFYAIWEESYSVVYDANGGTDEPSYHKFFISENLTISLNEPTRYGYEFKGWSYTKGGNVSLKAGDTVAGSDVSNYIDSVGILNLYAVWEKIYTLTYIYEDTIYKEDNYALTDKYTIPIEFPGKEGYTFAGWSLTDGGTAKFTPGKTGDVSELIDHATGDGIIKLYAIFYKPYKIKTNVDGEIKEYGSYYDWEDFFVPSNLVTKENYEFVGWSFSSDETNIISENSKISVSSITSYADKNGGITLYAVYKKNYTIKFNANGGENAPSELTEAVKFIIPNMAPTKEGYSFAGWQIDISSNKVYIPTDTVTISDISNEFKNDYTITLYAKWSEKYTIEYDANGGENAPQSSELSSLTGNLSTTIPTKEGYIFKGWAYQNNSENPVYSEGGLYDINNIPSEYISDKHNIKLYAVWGKKYTIKFDANGGENAPNNLDTLVTGSLPESIPVKEGYKFKGWSLNKDGEIWRSSTGYYDLSDLKLENYELTLYAVWQKVSNSLKDVEIKITDEIIDEEIADIIIEEVFEDNEIFINIRNKANNRLNNKVTKLKVYNIYLVDSNNEKIQPTKDINLEISLPYGYTNNIIVYRMEDNNKLTKLISNINDNKISFTTSHFSYYSIVEVDNSENASLLDDESKENNNTITENQNVDNMSNSSNNNNKNNNNNESIENPPTGIVISVITLTTLALIAVGIKYFVKKKTLFRKL